MAGLVAASALLTSCGLLESGLEPVDGADCDPSSLEETLFQQNEGDFTARELAERSDSPGAARARLEELGFEDGFFSFWKEEVEGVPFAPPLNLVCQLIVFDDEEGARAFFESLAPEHEVLESAVIAWPHDGSAPAEIRELETTAGRRAFVGLPASPRDTGVTVAWELQGRAVAGALIGAPGYEGSPGVLWPVVGSLAGTPE